MLDATEEPASAGIAYAGTWRIEPTESNESVNLALGYPPSSSNRSSSIALTELGLTAEALAGRPHALRFELRLEAGRFVCTGTAGDGRGNGEFRFKPDSEYAKAIAATGIAPLTLHQQIHAGMFDVRSRFVEAIVATGLPHVTFPQVLGLKIFRIGAEVVSALYVHFPSASLDDLRALAMTGVTAGYVEALRNAKVGNLSADNVSALRAYGIEQAFIEGLAANNHHGLSIDEVVNLHGKDS